MSDAKRILVCGGAGYIGSVLCPLLAAQGHSVEIADELLFGNHLPLFLRVRQQNCWDLDETDFDGFNTVIFLAGLSNDPMADFDPRLNYISNGALPAYLAYQARRGGVERFIYGGSCSVYGINEELCVEGKSETNCSYPYGVAKLQGEVGVMQQAAFMSCIAFRQGTVCGYSPRMRFDLVVNKMVKDAYETGVITITNFDIMRPILDIQDAARAYAAAVDSPQHHGVFNVLSGNYKLGEIALAVKGVCSRAFAKNIRIKDMAGTDLRSYAAEPANVALALNFQASRSIEQTAFSVVNHIREFGDMNAPRYHNIATMKLDAEPPAIAAATGNA